MAGKSHKTQYYVWYLGWKECRGLNGQEFTEPIVRELLIRRRSEALPKLTIEVTKKELKVVQLIEKKKGKIDKVKYPAIPSRDITFATQALYPDEDVVACIYLGYNARTQCAVHVHVYRCDSPDTAALFVESITQLVLLPEHQKRIRKIEQELFEKGQVVLRPENRPFGYSKRDHADIRYQNGDHPRYRNHPTLARQNSGEGDGRHSGEYARAASELSRTDSYRSNDDRGARFTVGSGSTESDPYSPRSPQSPHSPMSERMPPVFDDTDGERQAEAEQEFLSLADELKARLKSKDQAPLLLPPKDYDTVHRKKGNLMKIENRKCLNKEIVGKSGVYKISSDDSARGDSDSGSQKNSNGDDDDVTMILGQSTKPEARGPSYEPVSPRNDPVVYTSETRVPFSPGPVTAELKKNSYFPSKEDLPNYLPGSRNSLNRYDDAQGSRHAQKSGKRHLRKQQSSPEFGRLPSYNRQRSTDEGYTSMGRNEYPPEYFESGPYGPPGGSRSSDIDLSQTVPPMAFREARRKNSKESIQPRVYVDENDPGAYVPIDYTVGKRSAVLKRANSGYY